MSEKIYQLGEKKKRFTFEKYLEYRTDREDKDAFRTEIMEAFEVHFAAPYLVLPGKRQKVGNMLYIEPVEVDRPITETEEK